MHSRYICTVPDDINLAPLHNDYHQEVFRYIYVSLWRCHYEGGSIIMNWVLLPIVWLDRIWTPNPNQSRLVQSLSRICPSVPKSQDLSNPCPTMWHHVRSLSGGCPDPAQSKTFGQTLDIKSLEFSQSLSNE